jgi:YD repeat-containing protein
MHLANSKEWDYRENGTLYTETNFIHGSPTHTGLMEKNSLNSAGTTLKTMYLYPIDAGADSKPLVNELRLRNMIGMPLVTTTLNNNEVLSRQETTYKLWDNPLAPLEPGETPLLAPQILKSAKGPVTTLEDRVKYNNVDYTNGNPQEVEQVGGMKISYIWGYNKTQPVAKLENIAYAAIPISLINAIQSASNAGSESVLLAALDELRFTLQNAMITTYTYKPLIGISTVTDPKGDRITYHYDGFNRLHYITDKEGHILKQNEYHYATQP